LRHSKINKFINQLISRKIPLTGHYVLICGYDAGADMFEIRDPASSKYPLFPLSTSEFILIKIQNSLKINVSLNH